MACIQKKSTQLLEGNRRFYQRMELANKSANATAATGRAATAATVRTATAATGRKKKRTTGRKG